MQPVRIDDGGVLPVAERVHLAARGRFDPLDVGHLAALGHEHEVRRAHEAAREPPRAMPADWIYAPDAADALARIPRGPMLGHPVYHVGGGALTDVAQWCAALARVLPGVRWRIADKGEPCTVQYALPADRPALDTTRLASELGHRCRFGLDESARDFLDWIAATSAQPFPSSSQEARDAAA